MNPGNITTVILCPWTILSSTTWFPTWESLRLSVQVYEEKKILFMNGVWWYTLSRAFVPTSKNMLRTTGIFCGKAFIAYLSGGKTPNRENGAAYIPCSMTFQHLMWRDSSWFVARPSPHYYATRWAVTRREFTLALAHKTCLLVRHNGSQHHLIMAIAHGTHAIARGTALHTFPSLKALPHMYHTGTHKYAQWS